MLKTSTEIRSVANKVGEKRAVEMIAKAGFDGWDFSMLSMVKYDWGSNKCSPCEHPLAGSEAYRYARNLRKVGEDCGIVCNQSHAPYPTYCPEIAATYEKCIELTAEAGGGICVIHPDNYKSAEENAEMFLRLLPVARACNVKIATENMWSWSDATQSASFAACSNPKSFLEHMEAVNDEYFVACLDVGHAELKGLDTNAVEMIEALGHHLQALHLHDNDRRGDRHRIPFSDSLDFDAITRALKRIGYSGFLTLEAVMHMSSFTAENAHVGVQELADSAKRLAIMVDNA
ncbi:MAG: sugar phosphate isomerase/epimerase [Clostridia bacterium]|nr:sugar phosphate isomerase/epimerase [Clostridia bacterium]